MLSLFIVIASTLLGCLAARVELDWDIGYVYNARDGVTFRRAIGVNGVSPIPTIQVVQGDTLVINVHNSLEVPTSLHAHGLYNNGTNYMDGPDMVTQCGIPPGENFTYVWETNKQYGTFWVHGHTRHQEVDGLHTPLIIHSRDKPNAEYDEELHMTFEDWFATEFYVRQAYIDSLLDVRAITANQPETLINAVPGNKTGPIKFVPGKRYRIRVICMSINNWFKFRIHGHKMSVIEADGVESAPLEVDGLSMGPGQRYSVIVTAHNTVESNYLYNVTSYSRPITRTQLVPARTYTGLIEYRDTALIKNVPLPRDEDLVWAKDGMLQALDKQTELPIDRQINLTMHKFQGSTMLAYNTLGSSLYEAVRVPTLYTALSMGDLAANSSIYGPQTNAYILKHLEVVEVVITNTGTQDHTYHFHGHDVQVTETGPAGNSSSIGLDPVPRIRAGPSPIRRDTVQVLAFQYVRVRFRADNPGVFLVHCHLIVGHFSNGLAVVFVEAPEILQQRQKVPEDMLQMCERQGIPTSGNGAGNQGFDLSGLAEAVYPPK